MSRRDSAPRARAVAEAPGAAGAGVASGGAGGAGRLPSGIRVPAALFAVTALSRAPFLADGYGLDPDAWLVARAAERIVEEGTYAASRLPGNPVHEFGTALVSPLGPVATNGLTALWSAVAVVAFYLALRSLRVRAAGLAALAFAFTPVFFFESTETLDYAWAAAFLMGSLYLVTRGRAAAAGAALGLAIGCRITSGAMLLPLALLAAFRAPAGSGRAHVVVRLTAAALVTGGIAYLPVLVAHGPGFLTYYQAANVPAGLAFARATEGVWGRPGWIALALAFAVGLARVARVLPRRHEEPAGSGALDAACLLAVALYAVAFARLPHEPGYLVAAVPFALVFAARAVGRPAFAVVAAAVVASSFLAVDGSGIHRSGVFRYRAERVEDLAYARAALEAARERAGAGPVAVFASWYWPKLDVLRRAGPDARDRNLLLLDDPDDPRFAAEGGGRALYVLDRVAGSDDVAGLPDGVRLLRP